ncbi:MAG: MFS transporter [Planctomycetales bacterium]
MGERASWRIRWRLSVLWALEWGITGAILTYLPLYFTENDRLTREQLSQLMAVSAVGLWVAPLVVGQICDRWLATEKYLAIAHFVGGLALVAIPIATDMYEKTGENFAALVAIVGLYAVCYFPTVPLATSLTFRHLPDPDSQFGRIRIWGTVGWVLAGLSLSLWLGRSEAYAWLVERYPQWAGGLAEFRAAFSWLGPPTSSDCFRIAAMLSFALSSFCVFLPATPPSRSDRGAVAPLHTLAMFRDRTFALLIAITFLLALVVPFYSLAVPMLLKQMGFQEKWVPAVMTIGQISEFPALLLVAYCLKRYGLKAIFAMGMAAWLVRYVFFAFESPTWLVLSGIALHGVCHVFLIIVIQLYVDRQCRSDLRASAQNLFAFLTMGIAMPLGFLLSGWLLELLTSADVFGETVKHTDYTSFFAVPAAFILLLLIAFGRWFRLEESNGESPGPSPAVEYAKQAVGSGK